MRVCRMGVCRMGVCRMGVCRRGSGGLQNGTPTGVSLKSIPNDCNEIQ